MAGSEVVMTGEFTMRAGGDDDPLLVIPPEVQAQIDAVIAKDPTAGEAFRVFFAQMRQAMSLYKAGQYASFDDAVEAQTGKRPAVVEEGEEWPRG